MDWTINAAFIGAALCLIGIMVVSACNLVILGRALRRMKRDEKED